MKVEGIYKDRFNQVQPMRIAIIQYGCLKCGNSVELQFTPPMQKETLDRFEKMHDARLCYKCMPITDKMIECAAEAMRWLI